MILNLKVDLELEVKFKLVIYAIYAISLLKTAELIENLYSPEMVAVKI